MTLAGMSLSRSFCATRRTFALPNTASFHGANATIGGIRGLPNFALARSIALAGVGPSKMWMSTGPSTSMRATPERSEHMSKSARVSDFAVRT